MIRNDRVERQHVRGKGTAKEMEVLIKYMQRELEACRMKRKRVAFAFHLTRFYLLGCRCLRTCSRSSII